MSAEIVIRAEVRTAADLIEVITKWVVLADPEQHEILDGFVVGYIDARIAKITEGDLSDAQTEATIEQEVTS